MKRIPCMALIGLILIFSGNLRAQNKNTIRIGAGINVREEPDHSRLRVGPSLLIEYGREINRYFSLAAEVHTDLCKYADHSDLQGVGISLRGMVTPLPNKFRWIKVGVGATYERRKYIDGVESADAPESGIRRHMEYSTNYWGIDFPIRAYFIDSKQFEFYAFYNLKTMFSDGDYFWNYSNGGLAFGIKF